MRKIYVVSVFLNKLGFKTDIYSWDIEKETKLTYKVSRLDKDGQKHIRFFKVDSIGNIDTFTVNSHSLISFYSRCFEGEISETKNTLNKKVIETANAYKESIDKLLTHLL
jgi:hypothetical protein